jgi:DNA-binding HxlR family transcriptional regulator
MQRKSFADVECNIARSVEEVGDGWSLMILRNALLGAKRFQDFEAQPTAGADGARLLRSTGIRDPPTP